MPVSPQLEIVFEFTADGKYQIRSNDPKTGVQVTKGTYTVEGNSIRLTSKPDEDKPSRTRRIAIQSITDEELRTVAGPSHEPEHSALRRVVK
jgi:uncharacterized protein (TIGR03066 family)